MKRSTHSAALIDLEVDKIAGYLIIDGGDNVCGRGHNVDATIENAIDNGSGDYGRIDIIDSINDGTYELIEVRRKVKIKVEPDRILFKDLQAVNF